MLKKLSVSILALTIMTGSYAQAQFQHGSFNLKGPKPGKDLPDIGQAQEPAVQPDESVADFIKGKGGSPKNKNSVFNKNIKLKQPTIGGNGCSAGTVGAALTEDKKTLSVVFDNYVAEAGASAGVKRDVKNCSVAIPVEVPAGMQFMLVKLDYRGFNSIPANARTRYITMYSMVDPDKGKQIGKRIRRKFDFFGPLEEEYIISSDISNQIVWSKCGKTVNFKIDTRIAAATNKNNEDVMATIDSLDASAGGASNNVEYHLLWQECK